MSDSGVDPIEHREPSQPCFGPDDVGQIEYDAAADIWFECRFDDRRRTYGWVIIPPVEH